jgi:hypothetical protein
MTRLKFPESGWTICQRFTTFTCSNIGDLIACSKAEPEKNVFFPLLGHSRAQMYTYKNICEDWNFHHAEAAVRANIYDDDFFNEHSDFKNAFQKAEEEMWEYALSRIRAWDYEHVEAICINESTKDVCMRFKDRRLVGMGVCIESSDDIISMRTVLAWFSINHTETELLQRLKTNFLRRKSSEWMMCTFSRDTEKMEAFLAAFHPRLGENSPANVLKGNGVVEGMIWGMLSSGFKWIPVGNEAVLNALYDR